MAQQDPADTRLAQHPPPLPVRLLLIEDSANDADLLVRFLKSNGFEPAWQRVDDEAAMTEALEGTSWDMVLADYVIPGFDCLEALALVRKLQPELPFVIVTGKVDEPTAVNAMTQGAADFVHKERLARLVPVIHRELAYAVARRSAREHGLAVRRTLAGMFEVIERTVESRDTYTSGHHRRGADLCVAIGREMGFTEDRLEGIQLGAMIHDLGNLSVPAEILSRPGRLSVIEMGLVKFHSQVGHDILRDVESPWPLAQIALQHHERMDGSGYPQGLKGDEILPEARVIAVADVMEAMASHRPYRKALGIDVALAEVEAGGGSKFDPDVVRACQGLFAAGRFSWQG